MLKYPLQWYAQGILIYDGVPYMGQNINKKIRKSDKNKDVYRAWRMANHKKKYAEE